MKCHVFNDADVICRKRFSGRMKLNRYFGKHHGKNFGLFSVRLANIAFTDTCVHSEASFVCLSTSMPSIVTRSATSSCDFFQLLHD